MTLTVTLELSPLQEKQLRTGIAIHDEEGVRQLLVDALEPTIVDLFKEKEGVEEKDSDEWHELSALLVEELATSLPNDFQGLSDYAVSREGIYADHP